MSTTQQPVRATRSRAVVAEPARESIEWLVDNDAAWNAVLDSIASAERTIWITQLAFDADCRVYSADGDGHSLLLDALAAASARGVAVRILLNETFLLDTATALRRTLRRRGADDIVVRGISHFPQLIHAKLLLVDERDAMLIGSPFVNGYWDDSRHRPRDARRPERELGGRPLHDLSLRVTGSPVSALASLFASLWNDGSIGSVADPGVATPRAMPSEDASICVTRTAGDGVIPGMPDGCGEILSSIERGIAGARRFIYIEHQYLSSVRVIAALARALERESELEIVAVLNQNPDVTAYRVWQNTRLRDAGLLDHPRVGLFALWTAEGADVSQVFVHSKVLVVDDEWMTAGSANLDGVSLHSYGADFTSRLGERIFRNVRNLDVNLELGSRDALARDAIAELVTHLWREHLARPSLVIPEEGRLALWKRHAAECVAALNDNLDAPSRLVLPYSTRATPATQLRDVGVHAPVTLSFDPSWLEVHCSPNWIRNMFA